VIIVDRGEMRIQFMFIILKVLELYGALLLLLSPQIFIVLSKTILSTNAENP